MTTPEIDDSQLVEKMRFEDLSISELIGVFFRSPRTTIKIFINIVSSPIDTSPEESIVSVPLSDGTHGWRIRFNQETVGLVLYLVAFLLAFWGSIKLVSTNAVIRTESQQLAQGIPYLFASFTVWILADILQERLPANQGKNDRVEVEPESFAPYTLWNYMQPTVPGVALLFTAITWFWTANNQFSTTGFWAWILSIILVVIGFFS